MCAAVRWNLHYKITRAAGTDAVDKQREWQVIAPLPSGFSTYCADGARVAVGNVARAVPPRGH